MVAAAENMQAFGWDLFSGNRDSVFLGSGSIAGDELDISSFVVLPGFVDVHVHLREPGFSYKETISSGTLAAAHGGYSRVCAMPNLDPAPDSLQTLAPQLERIRTDAVIDVTPYGAITAHRGGRELADMEQLAPYVAGFSDDGSGVQDADVMRAAMRKAASLGKLIAAHCEDNTLLHGGYIHDGAYARAHGHKGISSESEWRQLERDLELVRETGCAYHMCHVSTKESVALIRRAKAQGLDVTCETAPHYLVLTEDDLREDGSFKMNPPLRTQADRDALLEGILDGTVDMIATDHAPHSEEDKLKGMAGMVGSETAFGVCYTKLCKQEGLPLELLVHLMSTRPAEILGLAKGQHRVINDQAGIFQLCGVGCHGADAAALGHGVKHAVAAVLAASHDKVADKHLPSVRCHCHRNAAAGVLVGGQIIVQVDLFHVKFSYYGTPPVACGDSPLKEGAFDKAEKFPVLPRAPSPRGLSPEGDRGSHFQEETINVSA